MSQSDITGNECGLLEGAKAQQARGMWRVEMSLANSAAARAFPGQVRCYSNFLPLKGTKYKIIGSCVRVGL